MSRRPSKTSIVRSEATNGGRVEFRFKHSTSNFKETAAFVDVLGAFIKATISERGIWNQIQNSTRLQKLLFVSPVDYDEYKQYGDDAAVITPDVMRDMSNCSRKL
jgi:hypothetical protein